MKYFKNLSFFLLISIIWTVKSAPTSATKSLYDTISSDKRFEKLRKEKFIKECEKNTPICTALIDVTFRVSDAQVEFSKDEIQQDESFCDSKLLKILPDTPTSKETSALMKSFNLTWFKDILNSNDGNMCTEQCTFTSYDDYSVKVKPVCVFIYDQYKLLESIKNGSKNEEKTKSGVESTSAEQQSAQKESVAQNVVNEAGTLVDVVEAKKGEVTQNVTVNNKTSTEEQKKVASNETKKVDELPQQSTSPASVVASSNKTETAQIKTDTKTTNINLDDEQSSLVDSPVFDQTQGPDGDENANLENIDGGVNGDDDDDDLYPIDFQSRDNNQNGNKFPQEQVSDVEPHDSDNPQSVHSAPFEEDPDSNFFTYLCIIMFLTIVLYILYHNRQKLLALLLEGRQGRNSRRPRSRGGSKAAYSKLDCNLEEAITSKKSLSGKSMDIIY